jgi:hypothetical protein
VLPRSHGQGRRFLCLALVVILTVGVLAPYLRLHSDKHTGARPVAVQPTAMAASIAAGAAGEAFGNLRGPAGPFRPGGPRPIMAHDETVLSPSDTSPRTSLPAAFTNVVPTAGLMLAVGFCVGTLLAFAQPFMSAASRTRGQPAMA